MEGIWANATAYRKERDIGRGLGRRSKEVWNTRCVLLPAYWHIRVTAPLQNTKGERLLPPLLTLCIQPSDSALFGDWIRFWPFVNKDNIIYYSYISVVRRRALQVADLILCSSNTWLGRRPECCAFSWKRGLNQKESLSSLAEMNLSSRGELSFLSCGAKMSSKTAAEGWLLKRSLEWLNTGENVRGNK